MRSPTTAAGARIQRRYIPENIHFQRSGLTRFPSLDESRALQRAVILWRSYLLGEVRQNEGHGKQENRVEGKTATSLNGC